MSSNDVLFRFNDGVETPLSVPSGQTILEAGLTAGVPLLYQCRSGSCSSCMARLVSGDAQMRPGVSSTLLSSEAREGYRLLCQTEAQSACAFDLNYDSKLASGGPKKAHAFIDGIEKMAENVVRLSLELAEGQWLDFKPGQFMQITVPGIGVIRSYSPASTPAQLPKLQFLIRLLPGGAMSTYLTEQAQVDDVIELSGPNGRFFLRENIRAPHIFVAGGTGLAPILSMIDQLRTQPGRKSPLLLSFGCATPDMLFGLDDLALRLQWMPHLSARISVDREATGNLHSGNPVQALRPDDITDPNTVAYVCGPPMMIEAARSQLLAFGIDPENLFSEQFVATN
jgi:benzoate/toluate 1,2-dioxygenase reductase subunit